MFVLTSRTIFPGRGTNSVTMIPAVSLIRFREIFGVASIVQEGIPAFVPKRGEPPENIWVRLPFRVVRADAVSKLPFATVSSVNACESDGERIQTRVPPEFVAAGMGQPGAFITPAESASNFEL